LNELDEKPNHTKISKFLNFEGKVTRQRIHFFNHLMKKKCSMGSKCLALDASHMCKKTLAKKHV
jgi:hypothetical protein